MSKYTKSNRSRFFLCMAAVVVVSGLANADVIVSSADSYTFDGSPDSNYGSETSSLIKLDSAGVWSRQTYLRFAVSEDYITAATLTLNFIDSGKGVAGADTVYEFALYGLSEGADAWLEDGITWNNAPSLTGASDLGAFSVEGKGVGSVMFSSDGLKDFINADSDGSVSLVLVRTTDSSAENYVHAIATRENSDVSLRPSLDAIPEPAVLSMVVIFGGGILVIKRRLT